MILDFLDGKGITLFWRSHVTLVNDMIGEHCFMLVVQSKSLASRGHGAFGGMLCTRTCMPRLLFGILK